MTRLDLVFLQKGHGSTGEFGPRKPVLRLKLQFHRKAVFVDTTRSDYVSCDVLCDGNNGFHGRYRYLIS
jgi:hypothetical protein